MMKISYSNLACPEWSMSEVFENAARFGYHGVELRLYNGNIIPATLSAEQRQELRDLSSRHGIEMVGIGASTGFVSEDTAVREKNIADLIAYLELAADLGVPFVRTFGGATGADVKSMDEATRARHFSTLADRVGEALSRAAVRAEELGVDILLETHDDFSYSELVRETLSRVNSRRVGTIWDMHHPYRMRETALQTYANLKDSLRHVHVKDAVRVGGPDSESWQLLPLGQGEVPVREAVDILLANGYDGWFSVEWEKKWHPEIQPAAEALPQHIELMRKYVLNAWADAKAARGVSLSGKIGKGISSSDFVAGMMRNQDRLQDWMQRFEWPSSEDQAFFNALGQKDIRCFILCAEWCGDVVRNVPVVMRALEHSGVPTEVLILEDHLDVMDQFLTMGGRSIPQVLFTDGQGVVKAKWGPRPIYVQEPMVRFKQYNADSGAPDYEANQKAVRSEISRRCGEGVAYQGLIIRELKGLLSAAFA